ncbi:MAG TPA: hypothetical protein VGN95_11685 [Pyrinomonadaceae bacterium]|jgi:hypothetical protein|nr:hypothetical protein [Pyrinomonadaceae bacterium]
MKKAPVKLIYAAVVVVLALAGMFITSPGGTVANAYQSLSVPEPEPPVVTTGGFEVEVLVDGRPLEEYAARGRHYVEALDGAEYELRIRNPLGVRVAVALSVDGMNSIDARRSSAWDASKWVIEPYQTITISGWQMSSSRARRFYFTTERDSYGAKLGQTANLGVINAVFFREREPVVIVTPPRQPRPYEDDGIERNESPRRSEAPSSRGRGNEGAQSKSADAAPRPDDDYAATGIGRNVRNDVRWVNMDLQSRPAGEVLIRYEYRDALVRLGIIPRPYPRTDTLRRRERSTGFENRGFSPEP